MPTEPISLTITAHVDPALDEDTAPAVGDEIAARLGVEHASSAYGLGPEAGWASWTVAVPNDRTVYEWSTAATLALQQAVPADHTVRVDGLELLAMGEVNRRLAVRGAHRSRTVRRAEPGPRLPSIPEVVTTGQFADLLGVTPTRVRQLRAERLAAVEAGGEHPFPAEFMQDMPGYWLKGDAEAYAAVPRPKGRPPRAETACGNDAAEDHDGER